MLISRILDRGPDAHFRWIGLIVWSAVWLLMGWLDGTLALGNLALLLVMGGAMAALWMSPLESLACSALSVLSARASAKPIRGICGLAGLS